MEHIISDGTNLTPSDIVTLSKLFDKKGYLKVHRTSGLGKAILREAEEVNDKMLAKKVSHATRLKVKKDHTGNFTFTVYLGGCGATAEDAWNDAQESIAVDGLGQMPDLKDIELDEQIDDDGQVA
jgi:hypothetical protein